MKIQPKADITTPPISPSSSRDEKNTKVQVAVDEPQNALTCKFTEEEWDALRQLRLRLDKVYTNAYGPDAPEPKVFSLWGIPVDVANSASDPRASVVLMKFLRAAKALNVDVAQVLLTNALKWRKMFKIISTDKVMTSAYKNSSFTHFGHDKEGIPVIYLKVSKINWERFRIDRIGALVSAVISVEQQLRTADFQTSSQIVLVSDFSGMKLSRLPPSYYADEMKFMKYFYPDFCAYTISINTPCACVINGRLWLEKLFRPRLRARLTKITAVGTDKNKIVRALLAQIDAEQLPNQFGGKAVGFTWPPHNGS